LVSGASLQSADCSAGGNSFAITGENDEDCLSAEASSSFEDEDVELVEEAVLTEAASSSAKLPASLKLLLLSSVPKL